MAIKSGQILYTAEGFLIDRIQNGGVSSINLSPERVYELGNYQTLTTLRDVPDLSFDVESYDTSTKMESLLLNLDPTTAISGTGGATPVAGTEYDFSLAKPMSILSPFRSAQNYFNTVNGVIVPHLFLDTVTYRFGVKAMASQSYTFKGDSIFFTPGNPVEDKFVSDGTSKTYTLTHPAIAYFNNTLGETQHVLNVSVYNPDGTYYRLFNGVNFDYTDTAGALTLNTGVAVPVSGAILRVQYGTTDVLSTPQSTNTADGITVKPAAIRAKDIDIYMGTGGATPTFSRWTGVQSFDMTRSVNLDADEEFGNPLTLSQDYVTAMVEGTITVRNPSVTELFRKLAQTANIPANQVIGALSSTPIPMQIRLSNPDTGARLKTIYVPDARFDPPASSARVNQKLETPFKWTSDTGQVYVYDGVSPLG